jgi:hypothetical protein
MKKLFVIVDIAAAAGIVISLLRFGFPDRETGLILLGIALGVGLTLARQAIEKASEPR